MELLDLNNTAGKPCAVPSEIYSSIIYSSDSEFLENFMGYGGRSVKFLGHGTGFLIDELSIIENTFVLMASGGRCITRTHPGLMQME